MNDREQLIGKITELLNSQQLGVLSTMGDDFAYSSLMAFVTSDDLKSIYFFTNTSTRKYDNLTHWPGVSLLVHNRVNPETDFKDALSVTAVGSATSMDKSKHPEIVQAFQAKIPYLSEFIQADDSVLIRIDVKLHVLIENFEQVRKLHF